MKQVFIDEDYYNEIQIVAAAKGITPNTFIARAIGGELAKDSNQAILKPLKEIRRKARQ